MIRIYFAVNSYRITQASGNYKIAGIGEACKNPPRGLVKTVSI